MLAVNPSLEYIAALYGIMQLGAVPVPCFPPLRPKELDRFHAITVDCAPKGIVIDEMYREPIEALRRRLESSDLEPVGRLRRASGRAGADDLDPVPTAARRPRADPVHIRLDGISERGLPHPRQPGEQLRGSGPQHGRRPGPGRLLMVAALSRHGTDGNDHHVDVPGCAAGPDVADALRSDPRRWLKAITDYRVTITVGPNFSLDMCSDVLAGGDNTDLDLSTVKRLYCGAEPISADTLARFEQAAAPLGFDLDALIPCYGMAEATLFVSGKRPGRNYRTEPSPEPSAERPRRRQLREVDSEHTVRIVDPTSLEPLNDGLIGEIWVSGPSVAAGYHNRPELTRRGVRRARLAGEVGEYLRTGDLGFVRSGELFVTGRIKDLIIVNGRNIYPQDVEAAVVRADPAFRIAVAFSIPGDNSEQLCVVAEVGHREVPRRCTLEMVEAIRSSVTSEFGIGPHVHIGPKRTIPTTTSGKVRRQEARRMFLANELRLCPIDSPATRSARHEYSWHLTTTRGAEQQAPHARAGCPCLASRVPHGRAYPPWERSVPSPTRSTTVCGSPTSCCSPSCT